MLHALGEKGWLGGFVMFPKQTSEFPSKHLLEMQNEESLLQKKENLSGVSEPIWQIFALF